MAKRLDSKHLIYYVPDSLNIEQYTRKLKEKILNKENSPIKKVKLIRHNKKNRFLYKKAYSILKKQNKQNNVYIKRCDDNYTFGYYKGRILTHIFKLIILKTYNLSDLRKEKIKNIFK